MNAKETAQYIELLEDTLRYTEQQKSYLAKLLKEPGQHHVPTYLKTIKELEEFILSNKDKMQELKAK